MLKKAVGVTLALAMVVTAIPVSASAEGLQKSDNNVVKVMENGTITATYLDNGKIRTQEGCKEFENNMSDGWYVLNKHVHTMDQIVIRGKVNLILQDDMTLNARKGIYITKDSELTIWAQSHIKDKTTGD